MTELHVKKQYTIAIVLKLIQSVVETNIRRDVLNYLIFLSPFLFLVCFHSTHYKCLPHTPLPYGEVYVTFTRNALKVVKSLPLQPIIITLLGDVIHALR